MITRTPYGMNDMFNRLRPRPTGPTFPSQPSMLHAPYQEEPSEDDQYFNEIMRIRQEGMPSMSRYREMLGQMPQEADYKPNWMTRIAAGLSGMSAGYRDPAAGVQTAMSINRSPYMRAMERYKGELGNAGEMANLELEDVNAQTKALYDARAMGLKYKDYVLRKNKSESDITAARDRAATDAKNADTNARRAGAYETSVKNTGAYQQGQLGIGRRNAATNERNASTNRMNADTNRDRMFNEQAGLELRSDAQNALQNYRKDYLEMRRGATGSGKPATPRNQLEAVDLALRQLSQDPDFSDYVEGVDDSGYLNYSEDDGSPEYQVFMEELEDRVSQILKGQTFPTRKK